MDMKKGVVNETVKENRGDELSAMFNMMMEQRKKDLGWFDHPCMNACIHASMHPCIQVYVHSCMVNAWYLIVYASMHASIIACIMY